MRPQRVVVAAFLHDGEKVLLAKRAAEKAIAPGAFHLPGGHVEWGEDPHDALRRELDEELGVRVAVGPPIAAFTYRHRDVHTVGIAFEASLDPPGQVCSIASAETSELRWCSASEAEAILAPQADHDLAAVRAGFARLRAQGPGGPDHSHHS